MLSGSREEKLRTQGVPAAIIASMRSFEEQQLEQRPARASSSGQHLSEQPELGAIGMEPAQASETSHLASQSAQQAGALKSASNAAQSGEFGSLSSSKGLRNSTGEGQLEAGPHTLQGCAAPPSVCAEGNGTSGFNNGKAAVQQSQPEQQSRQSWPRLQSSAHDRSASREDAGRSEQPGLPAVAGQHTAGAGGEEQSICGRSVDERHDEQDSSTGDGDTKHSVHWARDLATEESSSRGLQADSDRATVN